MKADLSTRRQAAAPENTSIQVASTPTLLSIYNRDQRRSDRQTLRAATIKALIGLSERKARLLIKEWERRGRVLMEASRLIRKTQMRKQEYTERSVGLVGFYVLRRVWFARRIMRLTAALRSYGEGTFPLPARKSKLPVGLPVATAEQARMN